MRMLLPTAYLDGARVTSSTLRPVREAHLVPENNTEVVEKVMQSYCLTWGGIGNFIIPYSPTAGLSSEWEEVLYSLDPDRVITIGNFPADSHERLKDAGCMVFPHEELDEFPITTGVLLHSALAVFGEYLKPSNSNRFMVSTDLSMVGATRLPLMARFGSFNEAELQEALNSRWSYRYQFNLDLSSFVEVRRANLNTAPLPALTGNAEQRLTGEETELPLSLSDLLTVGLNIRGAPRSWVKSEAKFVEDEYGEPVLVTGEEESVEDLSLFWNLRSERFFSYPFPMWIPLSLLKDDECKQLVDAAVEKLNSSSMSPRVRKLRIVSASTSSAVLEEELESFFPEAEFGIERLSNLLPVRCEYKRTTEQQITQIEGGRANVRPLVPEDLKDLGGDINEVAYEISVEETRIPQAERVARSAGVMHHRESITAGGNFRFVRSFGSSLSEPKLLRIRVPDGWTILTSILEQHGYEATPTAKSKTTLGQLELFGGIDGVKVAASSKVHNFLRKLSTGRGQGRAYILDRQTTTLNELKRDLGGEAGSGVLKWLIAKRVLFRGTTLQCPSCQLSRWYEVDRLGEVWRCDGCKVDMPIPLSLDQTPWRYRINELYAHGLDQGTVTPLLTLHALDLAWGRGSNKEGLGFYPGIELKAKEGAEVPVEEAELDLVVLQGAKLTFVECKEDGKPLEESEKATEFAGQLAQLVSLAEHFGVTQILLTTSTSFPEDKRSLIDQIPEDSNVELVWLDSETILDPSPFHPLSFVGGDPSDYARPEGWSEQYMQWVERIVIET